MAFGSPEITAAVIFAVLAALYMLELSPRQEDGVVELGQTQVVLISKCGRVFAHISDVSTYPTWFPGIRNVTAEKPGPVETGKKYEEYTEFPLVGDIARPVLVISYIADKRIQWMYNDWSKIVITVEVTQTTNDRCLVEFNSGSKRTSYLYHIFYGIPMRIMYALKGRHAMFAVRSLFNDNSAHF